MRITFEVFDPVTGQTRFTTRYVTIARFVAWAFSAIGQFSDYAPEGEGWLS